MKEFRKTLEAAIWFFKGKPDQSPNRSGRENKSLQGDPPAAAPLPEQSINAAPTPSGSRRAMPESSSTSSTESLEKYGQLAEELDSRVREDRGWLRCLRGTSIWRELSFLKESDMPNADKQCSRLSKKIFELISHFASEYNDAGRPIISMTAPFDSSEKIRVSKSHSVESHEQMNYLRWRASTSSWALSCRSKNNLIEFFLVPASDLMALSQAEMPMRLKLRLELCKVQEQPVWTNNGFPVSAAELRFLARNLFRDLISASQDQDQPAQTASSPVKIDDARLASSIQQLMIERENLAQKVVIQQEEIQKRIARDLHDAVISDVMALKRNISSQESIPVEETLLALEGIVRKLREICYDLSPRDLSDWGLATVVEDMLSQMEQRSGIDCHLYCDTEIPVMPAAVLLHIYRIIQESLNNAEKYAEPSRAAVTMEMQDARFVVTIADNGKGFEQEEIPGKAGRSGGYGMGSLRERSDLIRCFFPSRLSVESIPGKGTKVKLEIDLSKFA